MTRSGLALLAALAATAAGCGGSDPLASAPVATTRVELPQSYRFDPPVIEVEPGESFARPFPQPGTFHYVCTLHPRDMEGEVRVGQ